MCVHLFNIFIYLFFRIPEASSLMLNIILSDTIFNVFRDHNFDSCTICVCSNEGNIRGRDAAPYLPNFQGDDDSNCICGFSALSNRKLAHQSGLFYEVRKIRNYQSLLIVIIDGVAVALRFFDLAHISLRNNLCLKKFLSIL